jgi:hypothetical protein
MVIPDFPELLNYLLIEIPMIGYYNFELIISEEALVYDILKCKS